MDKIAEISKKIKEISDILGIEETDSNKDTPDRVAKMLANELFVNMSDNITSLNNEMKAFNNPSPERNNTIKIDIPFYSMCEHHWLPFFGTVFIEYIPDDKILGLSKFARIVEYFSKKPQLQETLTNEIGEYIIKTISPKELYVRAEAEHLCVSMRGIKSNITTTTTYDYKKENI